MVKKNIPTTIKPILPIPKKRKSIGLFFLNIILNIKKGFLIMVNLILTFFNTFPTVDNIDDEKSVLTIRLTNEKTEKKIKENSDVEEDLILLYDKIEDLTNEISQLKENGPK